jgi:hypothetical protein
MSKIAKNILACLLGALALYLTLFIGNFIASFDVWNGLMKYYILKIGMYAPLVSFIISAYFAGVCVGMFGEWKKFRWIILLFTIASLLSAFYLGIDYASYKDWFEVRSEFSGLVLLFDLGIWLVLAALTAILFPILFYYGMKFGTKSQSKKNRKIVVVLMTLLFLMPQPLLVTMGVKIEPVKEVYNIGDNVRFTVTIRNWQLIPHKISSIALPYGASKSTDAAIVLMLDNSRDTFTTIDDDAWVWPLSSFTFEKDVEFIIAEVGYSTGHRNYYEAGTLEMDAGENLMTVATNDFLFQKKIKLPIMIDEGSSDWGGF